MSNIRLGPWDLNRELHDQMEAIKARNGKTWRFMLTEACRLYIASQGMVPHAPVTRESYAHAPSVERLPDPAPIYTAPSAVGVSAAGVSAAGVSAAGVSVAPELTENEKRLERLINRRAEKQACLDAAYVELAADPKSLRANNLIVRLPPSIAEYDVEIIAQRAKVEAEKAAKENTGEVLPGEEV